MDTKKALLLSVFSLIVHSHLNAQWSASTPVCVNPATQASPVIVKDDNGGAIITWWDNRDLPGYWSAYSQRVNAGGFSLWEANGIPVVQSTGMPSELKCVTDGAGGILIAWAPNDRILVQRISGAGQVLWGPNGVSACYENYDQTGLEIRSDGNGGAILTWIENRDGNSYNIYSQRISAAGELSWDSSGVQIMNIGGSSYSPVIVSDGNSGAIIAWDDSRTSSTWNEIYAQRVSSTGKIEWIQNGVLVYTPLTGAALDLRGASDGDGGMILCWEDEQTDEGDIVAQRVTHNGEIAWPEAKVITSAPSEQASPVMESDGFGGAVIAWDDNRTDVGDIYAQRINHEGQILWTPNGVPVVVAPGEQIVPRIAATEDGGILVTWTDWLTPTAGREDIFVGSIRGDGTSRWPSLRVTTDSLNDLNPDLVSDGAGGAIVTWDRGWNNWPIRQDIFCSHIDIDGQLTSSEENTGNGIPTTIVLHQNFPNPWNPSTTVRYELPHSAHVRLTVTNILGHQIANLVDETQRAGSYEMVLNADNLPSGIYFYRLQAGDFVQTRKMALLK